MDARFLLSAARGLLGGRAHEDDPAEGAADRGALAPFPGAPEGPVRGGTLRGAPC